MDDFEFDLAMARLPCATIPDGIPPAPVPPLSYFPPCGLDPRTSNPSTLNCRSADFNVTDDATLKGVDQQSVTSLNGVRVTDTIMSLVPTMATLKYCIRCLKLSVPAPHEYSTPSTVDDA